MESSTAELSDLPGSSTGTEETSGGAVKLKSFVSRMTALVLLVGVISLILHLAISAVMVRVIGAELSANIGARAQLERSAILAAAPETRPTLAAAFTRPGHYVAADLPFPPDTRAHIPWMWPATHLLKNLRAEVGDDVRVGLLSDWNAEQDDSIHFSFDIDGKTWHILHTPPRPFLTATGMIVGWLSLLATGYIFTLILGARHLGRPLSNLAAQLTRQQGELRPVEMPAGSPAEVRALVAAFNQAVRAKLKADNTRQLMLAGLSHDLRTPLTRLRLRAETQYEGGNGDAFISDLDALDRIVNQFLAYVQGENGAGLGDACEIADVAHLVVDAYLDQGKTLTRDIDDVRHAAPDLAIQRILTNLIDNAFRYGDVPVHVELKRLERSKSRSEVALTVWDGGDGMTEAEFLRAKQPFSRLGAGPANEGNCGLGLAIVEQIAQSTGGYLRLAPKGGVDRFGVSVRWPVDHSEVRRRETGLK